MKYVLRHYENDESPEIVLSKEEFQRLRAAKNQLADALSIERQYAILVECFANFENEVLTQTTEVLIRQDYSYQNYLHRLILLDARLIGLLTCVRMYRKIVPTWLMSFDTAEIKISTRLIPKMNEEQEVVPLYAFMEGLRNFAQHHGFPNQTFSVIEKLIEFSEEGEVEFNIQTYAIKKEILDKASHNIKDVTAIPDRVNLKDAVRQYVATMSRIHAEVRSWIASEVEKSRKDVENAIRRFQGDHGEHWFPVSIARIRHGKVVEELQIALEWDNVRIDLEKRNILLDHVSRSTVTSRGESRKSKPAVNSNDPPESLAGIQAEDSEESHKD